MARSPILPIRLDDATRLRWKNAADAAGRPLASFVRDAVEAEIARGEGPEARGDARPQVSLGAVTGGKVFRGPDPKRK